MRLASKLRLTGRIGSRLAPLADRLEEATAVRLGSAAADGLSAWLPGGGSGTRSRAAAECGRSIEDDVAASIMGVNGRLHVAGH